MHVCLLGGVQNCQYCIMGLHLMILILITSNTISKHNSWIKFPSSHLTMGIRLQHVNPGGGHVETTSRSSSWPSELAGIGTMTLQEPPGQGGCQSTLVPLLDDWLALQDTAFLPGAREVSPGLCISILQVHYLELVSHALDF